MLEINDQKAGICALEENDILRCAACLLFTERMKSVKDVPFQNSDQGVILWNMKIETRRQQYEYIRLECI